MPASRAYSDPDAIAQIADLTLRSRRLAEGAISGQHRSPFHGFNIEFAAYREYTPGDDLRRLDWRVFARSDRHYIKQYEEESNVRVTFVMDASASMNYKGSRAALSKFDYASTLVVSLAMLLVRQQDPVGLVLFDEEAGITLPPSAKQAQVTVMTELLENRVPARKTELGGLLSSLTDRIRRRGFVVVVSDLFTDVAAAVAETPADVDSRARLRAGIDVYFRFIEQRAATWHMLFREGVGREATQTMLAVEPTFVNGIAAVLAEAPEAAPISSTVEGKVRLRVAAQMITGSMHWLGNWWVDNMDLVDRATIVDWALDGAWLGLEGFGEKVAREASERGPE